ncbi:Small GTPase superfamily and Small GTPase superfamily, Ras type and P-loop containing nucleoside triphosphate hydrolase domain-containing protein [Strongyloides ratti]|uniref:Small GTPase superfamily and Small GTPase superfamily, Ras type and P-loop containing nucleoside triphosphate hydrolase domain-containing protein n=1 Tax=Strongyloides ratti TaxID=34506 RepID=A0A090L2S6_STRRB|nr:Small GTPase superfamily and Small GTPase superfamily, Ras type and P-loop containing nucleoside triphosphate hydrolase domain-containing protein [Strongyloides ratti]CEF64116.1 Small GTPase superfamily and Small GTPase superfamily, Ras type and P-loop containing nucleoside triphosphate hydrolase domain-containing protein [Strongyloides ratti]
MAEKTITQVSDFLDPEIESIEEKVIKKKTLPEYKIAFIGDHSKNVFLQKLKETCIKYEKHVKYQDIHYFNFLVDNSEIVLEIFELGTEHTGAREMAIRKAEGIILFYTSVLMEGYHQLVNCVDDFKRRKKDKKFTPIYLISNEDPSLIDDINESSDQISSISEGYESESPTQSYRVSRRNSMEKIKQISEDLLMTKITPQQGENLAKAISPDCHYISINFKNYNNIDEFVTEIVNKINISAPEKMKIWEKTKETRKVSTSKIDKKIKSEKSSRNNSEKIKSIHKIKGNNSSAVCNIQ